MGKNQQTHNYIMLIFFNTLHKLNQYEYFNNFFSYRPRINAGEQTLPGHTTPLPGLHLCGGK